MSETVDITRELQRRRYYAEPARAVADFHLGRIGVAEVVPHYERASGRDAFIAWTEEEGWRDQDWRVLLMYLDQIGFRRGSREGEA